MDVNGIGTILPAVSRSFDVSAAQTNWVVSASTLIFAITLFPAGRWCARHGRRVPLLAGVVLLGASGVVATAAPDLWVLVGARAVQGFASALCFTTSLAVVDAAFDEARRPTAIGAFGAISGVGAALGPLVGGAAVDLVSWRAFFALNALLCVAAVPVLLLLVPPDGEARGDLPRLPGFRLAALSTGVVLTVVAVGSSATRGLCSPAVLAEALVALVAFGAAAWSARRPGPDRLLLESVRRSRYLWPTVVTAFSSTWAFGVTVVYASVYLQQVAHFDAFDAGGLFALYCASFAAAGAVVGPLVRREGPLRSLVVAMAIGTLGLVALAALGSAPPLAVVILVLVVAGAGQGLCFDGSTASALVGVPVDAAGEASAVAQASRLIGFSLGVAVSGSLAAGLADAGRGISTEVRAVFALSAAVSLLGLVVISLSRTGGTRAVADGR